VHAIQRGLLQSGSLQKFNLLKLPKGILLTIFGLLFGIEITWVSIFMKSAWILRFVKFHDALKLFLDQAVGNFNFLYSR
jgi:hypothetical protein